MTAFHLETKFTLVYICWKWSWCLGPCRLSNNRCTSNQNIFGKLKYCFHWKNQNQRANILCICLNIMYVRLWISPKCNVSKWNALMYYLKSAILDIAFHSGQTGIYTVENIIGMVLLLNMELRQPNIDKFHGTWTYNYTCTMYVNIYSIECELKKRPMSLISVKWPSTLQVIRYVQCQNKITVCLDYYWMSYSEALSGGCNLCVSLPVILGFTMLRKIFELHCNLFIIKGQKWMLYTSVWLVW